MENQVWTFPWAHPEAGSGEWLGHVE